MMQRTCLLPSYRWDTIQKALKRNEPQIFSDVIIDRVYQVLKNKSPDPIVWATVDLIENEYYRGCLTAFFLSKASIQKISTVMWIPLDVVDLFGKLVIDFEQFPHKIAYRSYAEQCLQRTQDDRVRSLMSMAMTTGPISQEYYWTDPGIPIDIKPKEMATHLASMAYFKAVAAKNTSINSETSKEAIKWAAMVKTQLKAIEECGNATNDPMGAFDVIEEFEHTKTAQEIGIPDVSKIIH